ncbi:MAG: acetyl-CoA decarbonylase/synthase complex subunit delta [Elusimicrobia bacterium]|nr:acetyl-CoA decarbonylase/synthase complex subunit delta [Elusimicrobiota bacterium]
MERLLEKSVSTISELIIGGGTRSKEIKIGGEGALPFLCSDGEIPNKPVIAVEVWDTIPEEWPLIAEEFKDIVNDVVKWSKKAEEWGADLICLRLESCHPDKNNSNAAYAAETVKKVLNATKLPLIIIGCGHPEKDQEILPAIAEAAKGEKILLGMATKDNYKTITAAALAAGHSVIAESPLDINLAKQLNILISDMGLPLDRIAMHHTTGGLGYGFEYCYSIMERCRLAGLAGDKNMATPIINMIAEETWKTKEAKTPLDEQPTWGELHKRALGWEIVCASGYLQAGVDVLVLEHPETIKTIKQTINNLNR